MYMNMCFNRYEVKRTCIPVCMKAYIIELLVYTYTFGWVWFIRGRTACAKEWTRI